MTAKPKRSVLLLDNDPQFAQDLRASLEEEGFVVHLVRHASEALSFLETQRVDAIVTDLFIRDEGLIVQDGGLRLISLLKQSDHNNVPIIAMSASFSDEKGSLIKATAKTLGASATLAKPFNSEDLLSLLFKLSRR